MPTAPRTNPNRHVHAYLEHYLNLPRAPSYAVLINGAWGIGKTHLVRSILSSKYTDLQRPAYVSLYGLKTHDEIDRALAHAIYPTLAGNSSKIAGQAARAVAGYFRIKPEFTMEQVVNTKSAPVYVFDDLERVGMPVSHALGYINSLVEHDGQKVIVIAHEEKILEPSYPEIREKLVGKTLEVQSTSDEALGSFLDALRNRRAARALDSRRAQILDIYAKSNVNNLRLLQQAVWEFERIFEALAEAHRQHEGAVTAVLALTVALALEVKANRLSHEELTNRVRDRFQAIRRDQGAPAMRLADDRYPGYDLFDQVLSDDVLYEVLFQGLVDEDKIRASVSASQYLNPPEAEAEWKTIWHFINRDEALVASAMEAMEKKFAARHYLEPGEILHVFALQLWRARNGLTETSTDEMRQACTSYIADLKATGQLSALENLKSEFELRMGYGGLGFTEPEEDFQELARSLYDARREVLRDQLPELAEELLQLMSIDIGIFDAALSFHVGLKPKFHDVPVLSAVNIDAFMGRFSRLSAPDQQTALSAIGARHSHGELRSRFPGEEQWLRNLGDALLAHSESLDPLNSHRVRQLAKWYVLATIESLGAEQ